MGGPTDPPPAAEHTRGFCPRSRLATPSRFPREGPLSHHGCWPCRSWRRAGQAARAARFPPQACHLPARSHHVAGEERQAEGSAGSETREEKERGCFCRLCIRRVHRTRGIAGPRLREVTFCCGPRSGVSLDRFDSYSHVFPLTSAGHALGNLRTTARSTPQRLPAHSSTGSRPERQGERRRAGTPRGAAQPPSVDAPSPGFPCLRPSRDGRRRALMDSGSAESGGQTPAEGPAGSVSAGADFLPCPRGWKRRGLPGVPFAGAQPLFTNA